MSASDASAVFTEVLAFVNDRCHPCEMRGGPHTKRDALTCEVRILKTREGQRGVDILCCHAHYDREMAFRHGRNRDLADPSAYDTPAWEDLPVWKDDGGDL